MTKPFASLPFSDSARDALECDVRKVAKEECSKPEYVSQRTVERWLSIPPRDYLASARAGAFATSKLRRLVLARTVDVVAFIEAHRIHRDTKPSNDDWAEALAVVGGRRVG